MYIPEHFRLRDHAAAVAFMRANSFAILVSSTPDGPFATHVPVAIRETSDQLRIRGHVAKANPHWKYLDEQPRCLMIFHGPHAYISPSNYAAIENVPTWNYTAVHACGSARTFSTHDELHVLLHDLVNTYEPAYAEQWAGIGDAYRDRMLAHIVGFEIAVSSVEAKFKLSQNRAKDEQQKIIDSLSAASDTAVSGVARLMGEAGLGIK